MERMQYIFELTSLTQIPIIEWEKYLDETAQIIVRKQSSEALLDARNRLYEIISRCIPPQTIFVVSYYPLRLEVQRRDFHIVNIIHI